MTMSVVSSCIFQSRNLIPARLTVQRYFSYNECQIKKRLFQHSENWVASRKFSVNSLPNFSSSLMNGLLDSNAFILTQNVFKSFHDTIGLPWWCVIVTSAAILKMSFLPLSVYQIKLNERYNLVGQQLQDMTKRISYEVNEKCRFYHWDQRKAQIEFRKRLFLERRRLVIENNCSPGRTLLIGYLELPAWIVLTIMWRTSSYGFSSDVTTSKLLLSQMLTEGPMWCSNLTCPDPFYIVPMLVLLSRLCHTQLMVVSNQLSGGTNTKFNKIQFNILRVFAFFLSFLSTYLPASVGLFWTSATTINCFKLIAFASPKVRRFLGLSYRSFSSKDLIDGVKNNILTTLKIKNKKI